MIKALQGIQMHSSVGWQIRNLDHCQKENEQAAKHIKFTTADHVYFISQVLFEGNQGIFGLKKVTWRTVTKQCRNCFKLILKLYTFMRNMWTKKFLQYYAVETKFYFLWQPAFSFATVNWKNFAPLSHQKKRPVDEGSSLGILCSYNIFTVRKIYGRYRV